MKTYSETLDYLYSQLPMFQRTGAAAYKNTLGNTLVLDEIYGHPHRSFKTIHVAGTNGKGSVSHMLASVLQEAGYKVGLYTSPHLVDFRERIRVDGAVIPEGSVVDFVGQFEELNRTAKLEPSFFEITVAMAFWYFQQAKVDVAVIEVGLGGRLDSTNIITPELAVITNISLDHTALLGNSIPLIAAEKAGVIKSNIPVVISESNDEYNEVFSRKASEVGAPIYFADKEYSADYSMLTTDGKQRFNFHRNGELHLEKLEADLLGNYQRRNVAGVLKAIELLNDADWNISTEAIYAGLKQVVINTGLRGRWEIVGTNPMVVCDTGHNEAGIRQIVEQIRLTAWKELYMVIGMVNDKSIDDVLALLPSEAHYVFTQASIPRALDAHELAGKAEAAGLRGKVIPDVKAAVAEILEVAQPHDLVFVGGSTFVVADYFS
ncbi:bifunctional folylpolyglutamate synthase/dihydrofolate synthase [Mangrovibacterium diazotrophicum]|uniref:Dihydrofolate synthase/folylpolyglutamate synthase n=1 Tax=Mangrovibacterium diazotrophicum TaxID=1261403 RepID=A0A419W731_9BACT|nr:folylpolyglutamate synthase/dihydrofolate synthase family protein [Mangrovibacterium diazotrophicum]RKD91277.1 dihydrofolate synthase/folylpolyglutamate synthase [Mangrovibacterium diazotrophicum]